MAGREAVTNINMSLAGMKSVLTDAQQNHYAVPAFNVCNLEYAQVVIRTAQELKSPVIVALHPVEIAYGGLRDMAAIVRGLAGDVGVPVVLHLDHGDSLADVAGCIVHGFTSVMIDASKKPLAENIAAAKEVVRFAHAAGVDVEAELGLVGGAEGDQYSHKDQLAADQLTDPGTAAEFVAETGVDSLAVAIGTAHGFYSGPPHIDLKRLAAIRSKVDIPLVLHGGSGTGDAILKESVRLGISKINIATELKYAFHQGLAKAVKEQPEEFEPRVILAYGQSSARELITQKIKLFGSNNRA